MVLVTGGTGLVGSHLIFDLLSKGYQVKAMVRKTGSKDSILRTFQYYSANANELFNSIIWAEGDIMDISSLEEALEGVEQVYHTAAFVSFNSRDKKKIIKTNVDGTVNLVNLCLKKEIQKFCFVSSIASLGITDDGSFITEEVLWKPTKHQSAYSTSKFKSEMEVWRGITEGLKAVIVNPSVILGPGDLNKNFNIITNHITKGFSFYTEGVTGFVDVRDVTQAMIKLMESNISGERFILSSENIRYKDLFKWIAEALIIKPLNIYVSPWIAGIIWRVAALTSFLFFSSTQISRSTLAIAYKKLHYSSKKIKEYLNFDFRPVKQTINDLVLLNRDDKKIK
jgi:nucleoside-diphosphate-sugar epimerase